MNEKKKSILTRLIKLTKIFIYIIILIINSIYLLMVFLKYYVGLKIKWKLSFYTARKIISEKGLDKSKADKIARDIVGKPPSLRDLYKIFRDDIRNG